jgi:hypothetical protein
MIQIVTASGEANASIIKGFLDGNGIKATFGPQGFIANSGSRGSNQPQNVFVEEDKAEEAMKLLKEQ